MKSLVIQNNTVLVDDEDLERVSEFTWQLSTRRNGTVIYRTVKNTEIIFGVSVSNRTYLSLPAFIMDQPGVMFDHKDRNVFNCCKQNLRQCTSQNNICNTKKFNRPCTSKYKGVHWDKRMKKWRARIQFNRVKYCLGFYDSDLDAAKAYNKKASELFGEFAYLNEFHTNQCVSG